MGQQFSPPVPSDQSTHLTMLIEEEAEAVFNEVRNRRRVLVDLVEDTKSVSRESSPGKKSVSPTPMITMNVNVLSSPEMSVPEIEEPVSPPSCHPDEGPPLLFSQSIQDLADVIVKENREKGDVEKKPVVGGETSSPSKIVPALIPLTVSEFAEKTASPPPSLRPGSHTASDGLLRDQAWARPSDRGSGPTKCSLEILQEVRHDHRGQEDNQVI